MQMARWWLLGCMLLAAQFGCSAEAEPEAPACIDVASADFDEDSGWGAQHYCAAPTELGCFPYHESSEDTCGPFTTMRTSATSAEGAAACATLLTSLNCATFASDDGATRLSFYIADADRFTMRVLGTYKGVAADTTFHFNPCHQNCQAAVTLDTLDTEQQKICEIPRQGKPVCLFPETAHSLTFVRADGGSVVIRTAGEESALARVSDDDA